MPRKKKNPSHSSFQETEARLRVPDKISKTKHAWKVESRKSTRQRMEPTFSKRSWRPHHSQWWKVFESLHLCTNLFPWRRQWKFRTQKQQWKKNGKKLETIQDWKLWKKVKVKKEGHSESTKKQKQSPLCIIDGQMSSQKTQSSNHNFRSTRAES